MIDLELTDEQVQLQASVRAFATRDLAGPPDDVDPDTGFSPSRWKACAELGLIGLPFPTEHGGQGADVITTLVALEALGYACRDNGLIFSINAHMWSGAMPVLRFGTPAQRERWLPSMIDGTTVAVQAMTEPSTGSDAFAMSTRAVADGDDFLLTGSKTFITNAPVADVFVVFAATDPGMGPMSHSAFVVDRNTGGLTIGKTFDKMGLTTSPMTELTFDECRVPAASMLGRRGNGMAIFNHSIDWERACILASAVGTMQREVDESVAYANERRQSGRSIGSFQAVSHRLAEMHVRTEAARLLLYKAGLARQRGAHVPATESAVAKLFISEAWVQTSMDALQIRGGYGYMRETGIEQDVRDAIASRIYSGTSDIQRNLIAAGIGVS